MRLHRRHLLALLACPLIAEVKAAQGENNAYAFSFDRAEGGRVPLEAYRGKPILIVNTATRCGLAGQFAGLEQLWQRYRTRGLMLIAVPSNDFGGQEPLEGAAIAQAARETHGATYAFAEKTKVTGADAHPFYRWAAEQGVEPQWNFHKILVDGEGRLVGSFPATVAPDAPELLAAIEAALPKP